MRLLQSLALIIITTSAVQAQRLVKLNLLEKSPLSNMIVVTKNDSTARYTKLVAGTGVTIAYNEADTTLTLSATASAGNTDEQTLTFDPSTGNLSISNGNTVNLTEGIQDAVANMLIAGTNVTLTYDDGAGTLTIAASGAGGGASDLGSLTDVDTSGKADGYVLAYNTATSTWEAQDNTLSIDSTGRVFTVALGNQSVSFEDQLGLTSVRLSDLQDVDTTGEATGSVLLYDATSGNWKTSEYRTTIDILDTINYFTNYNYAETRPDCNFGPYDSGRPQWERVDTSTRDPSNVVEYNGKFYFYGSWFPYGAFAGTESKGIQVFESESKFGPWVNKGLVLNIGASGSFDAGAIFTPNVFAENDTFYLTYSAWDGGVDGRWNIGLAYSTNPLNGFTKLPDPILYNSFDQGAGAAWDDFRVDETHIIKVNSTTYRMYYKGVTGTPPSLTRKTGYAYSNNILSGWTKYGSNPVLSTTNTGSQPESIIVWIENNKYWMTIAPLLLDRIEFYSSDDGQSWTYSSTITAAQIGLTGSNWHGHSGIYNEDYSRIEGMIYHLGTSSENVEEIGVLYRNYLFKFSNCKESSVSNSIDPFFIDSDLSEAQININPEFLGVFGGINKDFTRSGPGFGAIGLSYVPAPSSRGNVFAEFNTLQSATANFQVQSWSGSAPVNKHMTISSSLAEIYNTIKLNNYGLGNKEAADLSKTGSGYFLEVATDGTLIESTVTGGTAQTLSFNDATRELSISSGNTVDLTEGIQDEIAATVTAGEGITLTYDDALGTLTVAAPAGAGNTDEQTLSINNATAELSISNGNTVDLSEAIDNQVNTLFTDGTNILSTYDDISNTLTVRTTDALTQIDAITFDNNVTEAVTSRIQYNADVGTFVMGAANNVPIKAGQDVVWYVKNNTLSTIPKGTAVMAVGTDGNSGIMLIDEMVFDGSVDAKYFLGVTAEAITSTSNGTVISQGTLKGFDTSLIPANSVLYGDPTTPGGFTTTEPTGGNLKLPIANVLSQTNNGTIAIRVHTGLYIKDLHNVDVTTLADNNILKYNSANGLWEAAIDEVNDADADPTNEIQDLSLTGNTLSLSGDATTVDLSPYLDEATTASNGLTLLGTDVKLGGTLSDATTTIDMNSNALTFTNNGGYNLSGTGGLSFTNTSATDYSSVLSIASTNTRIYADGGTTEPLNSLNLTSTRSGVKELDLRSSISNDNTTYTMIALNPTRFSMKTPNVTDLTATNGQFLKLVDRLTGEVEFADALTAEVDGSVTNEIQDLSLTGNTLSLSSDATTVDLSPYLDDQTVTLTGGGITAISGTYPNFTITSTEVDGSVSNEGLLSASTLISGTTAALTSNTNGGSSVNFTANTGLAIGSSGGNTITFTNTLPEATTASNGLTETGNNIALGGDLTSTTIVDLNSQNLYLVDDGATGVGISILPASNEVAATGNLSASGDLLLTSYGLGNNTGTSSGYLAGFASDGTMIEIAQSTFLTSEVDGSVTNEGALSVGTSVAGSSVYIQSNTSGSNPQTITVGAGLDINSSGNTIFLNTKSYPIGSGTSASIDWGSTPQKIHVLDFGANTSLTLAFSNVAVGGIYTLRVTGNSGTDTLVWPAAAKFEDGTSTGTVTLQNGGQMFTFYYDGTNYWVK